MAQAQQLCQHAQGRDDRERFLEARREDEREQLGLVAQLIEGWSARRESKIGLQARIGAASAISRATPTVTDTVGFSGWFVAGNVTQFDSTNANEVRPITALFGLPGATVLSHKVLDGDFTPPSLHRISS